MKRLTGLVAAATAALCMSGCQPNDGIGLINETDQIVRIQSYSKTEGWRDIEQLKAKTSTTFYPGLPEGDGELQCMPDADYRVVEEGGTVLRDISKVCPGDDITIRAE